MNDEAVAYLIERQRVEQIPAHVMASRLGMGEATWCHVRKGRRRLTQAQIDTACDRYPELSERVALAEEAKAEAAVEKVA